MTLSATSAIWKIHENAIINPLMDVIAIENSHADKNALLTKVWIIFQPDELIGWLWIKQQLLFFYLREHLSIEMSCSYHLITCLH